MTDIGSGGVSAGEELEIVVRVTRLPEVDEYVFRSDDEENALGVLRLHSVLPNRKAEMFWRPTVPKVTEGVS